MRPLRRRAASAVLPARGIRGREPTSTSTQAGDDGEEGRRRVPSGLQTQPHGLLVSVRSARRVTQCSLTRGLLEGVNPARSPTEPLIDPARVQVRIRAGRRAKPPAARAPDSCCERGVEVRARLHGPRPMKADTSTPDRNVPAGARYLRLLLDRFQSAQFALAACNAGPPAVERAGGALRIGAGGCLRLITSAPLSAAHVIPEHMFE
jgi:Transglycosylase SLT domain